jgi:hypothetical protein
VRVILVAILAALTLAIGADVVAMRLSLDRAQAQPAPQTLTAYAGGATVRLVDAQFSVRPDPSTLYQAHSLYVLAYPFNLGVCTRQCGPAPSLPSHQAPECAEPCSLPGLPATFIYQDRVVAGDTAGPQTATFQLVALMYSPAFVLSPTFRPFASASALELALADPKQAQQDFLPLGRGPNPYEVATGVVVTGKVQVVA